MRVSIDQGIETRWSVGSAGSDPELVDELASADIGVPFALEDQFVMNGFTPT